MDAADIVAGVVLGTAWLVLIVFLRETLAEYVTEMLDVVSDSFAVLGIMTPARYQRERRVRRDANIARLERELGIGYENWKPIPEPEPEPEPDRFGVTMQDAAEAIAAVMRHEQVSNEMARLMMRPSVDVDQMLWPVTPEYVRWGNVHYHGAWQVARETVRYHTSQPVFSDEQIRRVSEMIKQSHEAERRRVWSRCRLRQREG